MYLSGGNTSLIKQLDWRVSVQKGWSSTECKVIMLKQSWACLFGLEYFFSLFFRREKKMMIGNITKKTMILSPPTTPHNKAHSDLFYFGESIVAVVKLSHNLQPEKPAPPPVQQSSSWRWSTKVTVCSPPCIRTVKNPQKKHTMWQK